MKELIEVLEAYLALDDILERTPSEKVRQNKRRKRALLNTLILKYHKQAAREAEQLALTATEDA